MDDQDLSFLKEVLVLSVRKNFWASQECQIFPNRHYAHRVLPGPGRFGSSRNPANVMTLFLGGYVDYLRQRPKLILFGAAPRLSAWFARLKRGGLLPGVKLVAPGAVYLEDELAGYIDRLYVFSRAEISLHPAELRRRYVFIPLPADGDFSTLSTSQSGEFLFAGGGAGRDFRSLIEAMRGLDLKLEIVTFSPRTLDYPGQLPDNCRVTWRMPLQDFLECMAKALFVVAPLREGLQPHGHTTLVQALRLGKAVVSTQNASVDDYVAHGREGLLVAEGDVDGYQRAILKLASDPILRASCERQAREKAVDLTYAKFAQRLVQLCRETL
jgi:glycosyltransferase involved in cell wall biosynthesis